MSVKQDDWKSIPRGGIIAEAGNAADYETGSWRTYRPIWDPAKCIHCLTCWILCPDSAIQAKGGKVTGIDYLHCKGCGICAHECPDKVRALSMVLETEAAAQEKK
jgi:2-oxoacid:acceptor oxidoreductase delta subunit (pyruvate/2-ketoisovalerate family)